jgi:hypothetical protein
MFKSIKKISSIFILLAFLIGTLFAETSAQTSRNAPVDFNGDGRTDFVVTGFFRGGSIQQEKIWYVHPNGGAVGSHYQVQWGLFTDINVPEDFDGDGRDDFGVWRPPTADGRQGVFYILLSSNNTFRAEPFGSPGDDPSVSADYDGDGKADPAVYRSGTSSGTQSFYYYRPSATPNVSFVGVAFGSSGDKPTPGDFDGDGRADFGVRRLTSNNGAIFYILKSNGGFEAVPWGFFNDAFAPGDYDGDGKTDFAVVRRGNGYEWYILERDGGMNFFQFGQYGVFGDDRIASGDYDGDGRIDAAVWRPDFFFPPSFYILPSNGAAISTFQWGIRTDLPVAGYNIR